MTPDEQAQVEAFIAAGKVKRLPPVNPDDASVQGMLAGIRAQRKESRAPRWKRAEKSGKRIPRGISP